MACSDTSEAVAVPPRALDSAKEIEMVGTNITRRWQPQISVSTRQRKNRFRTRSCTTKSIKVSEGLSNLIAAVASLPLLLPLVRARHVPAPVASRVFSTLLVAARRVWRPHTASTA